MTPAERDYLAQYIDSLDDRITRMEEVVYAIPDSITHAVKHCREERERVTEAAEEMASHKHVMRSFLSDTGTAVAMTIGACGTICGIIVALIR